MRSPFFTSTGRLSTLTLVAGILNVAACGTAEPDPSNTGGSGGAVTGGASTTGGTATGTGGAAGTSGSTGAGMGGSAWEKKSANIQ